MTSRDLKPAASPPNILIIMVDQLNGTLFPDGPADWLHAPNLKALAARSTRFANTYTASPLCAPGRASFMSGQLPSRTGVYDNAAEFTSSIPTYAHHLRRAGYQTCLSGKMHFVGPDQMHGFEERLTTDIYPADFGWTPDYRKPGERITPVAMECAAEASYAPMVSLRYGKWKYNRCALDPDQLFDLDADPHELLNLANDPAHTGTLQTLRAKSEARWDLAAYDADVRESQARRRVVYDALRNGAYYPWGYQPLQKASERYMRSHMKLDTLEDKKRVPREDGSPFFFSQIPPPEA